MMVHGGGQLLATLRLVRLGLVFTAVSNVWIVVLISDGLGLATYGPIAALPLWLRLVYTAGVAGGMYVFGMTLNDVLDIRHDRVFAPQRPLPAGQIGLVRAIAISFMALLVALSASVPLGTLCTTFVLICAMLVLFYNTVGKYFGGVGIITLGLIRATLMFSANPSLTMCWPVWLTLTHVVGVSAASYRLEGKRPPLGGPHIWLVTGGWAFLSAALIAWMVLHDGLAPSQAPWLWVGPVLAVCGFAWAAGRAGHRAGRSRLAGRAVMRLGLLWLIVYDAAWLLCAGLYWQAGLVGILLPAAWTMMTVLRRMKRPTEPLHYERGRRVDGDQVQPRA